MSTVFIAAILVGIIAAVVYLLATLDKKQKRRAMKQLLHQLHQTGTEHNLNFSSQELLTDVVLGLDGVHRKLLVVERGGGETLKATVIDLNEVVRCSVKKEFGTIANGESKVKAHAQYLKTISLNFVCHNGPEIEVVFYNYLNEDIYAITGLETKARHWEAILSKMVAPVRKIA